MPRGDKISRLRLPPKHGTEDEAQDGAWTLSVLKVSDQQGRLVLSTPTEASPAHSLGIRSGDILLAMDGTELRNKADLAKAILDSRFKTSTNIVVQRGRTIYRVILSR